MRPDAIAPTIACCLLAFAGPLAAAPPETAPPETARAFGIQVVDEATGRGVPLVELRTVHDALHVTDSAGRVAVRDPELFGQEVYFHVRSHGYQLPADGFGFQGVRLEVAPGGRQSVPIRRVQVAERLYRITGAGLYADSVLLGNRPPIEHPLLNAQVAGSDSVVTASYRGQIYWFWGDTNRLSYPLGNFHVSGATSRRPDDGGLDPNLGVDLRYFTDDSGFVKPMAPMPGEGPTWIFGLVVLPDAEGRERLWTGYEKTTNLAVHARGIARFDDEREEFVKVRAVAADAPLYLHGHPLRHAVNGVDYVYFGDPYPVMRVRAREEDLLDPGRYEGFTCLVPGGRAEAPRVERDAEGRVVWHWKRDTAAISWDLQQQLLDERRLEPGEAWLQWTDVESGRTVVAHRGSVAWNDYRRRWVRIATEIGGSSLLGEVWYGEADSPEGPWRAARKIVTHDDYSFYNPKQHPQFAEEGGRRIYFEGTYTRMFSGAPRPTPRYEYNQVMYRLDLTDPQLAAAQTPGE